MNDILCENLVQFDSNPFPHFLVENILKSPLLSKLLNWFELTEDWTIINTEFYEQYEFSFLNVSLPFEIKILVNEQWIDQIIKLFISQFKVATLELVDVTAHKHVNGQSIGIHNDYINFEETHRLVIHVNSNWREKNGGFLMMFNSDNAQDLSKVIKPLSNSALGFEISERSYHAVSKIFEFKRYSLVYTFKKL